MTVLSIPHGRDIKAALTSAINLAVSLSKMSFLVNNTKLTADLIKKITMPAFSNEFYKEDLQQMIDMTARYSFIKESFKADDILSKYIR